MKGYCACYEKVSLRVVVSWGSSRVNINYYLFVLRLFVSSWYFVLEKKLGVVLSMAR